MFLGFSNLKNILLKLNNCFPNLSRVNTYANGSSIVSLSSEQLSELRRLKLNTVYVGLETGDQKLLDNSLSLA